jgi:hypothetical protein
MPPDAVVLDVGAEVSAASSSAVRAGRHDLVAPEARPLL